MKAEGDPAEIENTEGGSDVAEIVANALDAIRGELVTRLEKLETKAEATERRLSRPAIITAPATPEDMAALEKKAFNTFLRSVGRDTTELKALQISAPGTGGVIAPPTVNANIIERLTEFSPIRSLVTPIDMGGSSIELPRLVDEVQPAMVTETGPRPESEPSLEKITLKPFEMAVAVPLSKTQIEDSILDIGGFVSAHIAKKFGKLEARQFVVGNGTTESEGVLTSTEISTFTTATAGKITADDLIDLFYSIPTAYASSGAFLMNRQTIAAVRKLRNSAGDLIWESELANGSPGTLLGARVFEAPDLPNVAAGATPIIFGDFGNGYAIGDRIGLEIEFDTTTGWRNGITYVLARRRVGGRVILGEPLTKLKVKA
ncbi:phage major capsid protein [Methylorubrum populi]|uniref:phage major capsid protein n=1 Tax=Methylorubrum populi TaxID=223967 RepID=UPI0031F87C6E